ncbi:MAG: nuclear transport factor 2 family protein [Anaerolineae bacterium]|nr:nuclear transport factor 2 family protein [Anaerolineae bacterium]MDK1080098.1 nuclear transport factor 2 family protein [Anaerolineae bacterium]
MSATEVVKEFFEAVNVGNIGAAADLLADNFEFSGPTPDPIGKLPFIGLTRNNAIAFPDWTFQPGEFQESWDEVVVSVRISGTHSGDWDLSALGIGVKLATNKSFDLPPAPGNWTVKDGKITAFASKPSPTNGLPGILSALRFNPPKMD